VETGQIQIQIQLGQEQGVRFDLVDHAVYRAGSTAALRFSGVRSKNTPGCTCYGGLRVVQAWIQAGHVAFALSKSTTSITEKGKPRESGGRKVNGLKGHGPMTAGLPVICAMQCNPKGRLQAARACGLVDGGVDRLGNTPCTIAAITHQPRPAEHCLGS
jgi:hypothetical protein